MENQKTNSKQGNHLDPCGMWTARIIDPQTWEEKKPTVKEKEGGLVKI